MTLDVLEFYSGIGGMHYALEEACPDSRVLAAFDINTTANMIYAHNFPETLLHQNNIQAIPTDKLDKFNAHMWTMSPPCQPFTKKGLQLGIIDNRCDSFMALLEKLKQMKNRPHYILLENVVGFESSSAHEHLICTLKDLQYGIQEFILSPLQFGIPNSRPRYYLLANSGWPTDEASGEISTSLGSESSTEPERIESYLETLLSHKENLRLSVTNLERYGGALDIVTDHSTRSACFTKSYGSYVSGCGSHYCSRTDLVDGKHLTAEALSDPASIIDDVRLFSPREVANLMCFPAGFHAPPDATSKQMYRCLGNSINVHVVAALMKVLLRDKR
ncbi:unnamed protein product [Nippostrongylus brasiliensis]|uniref:tRNA (cytosine(38)-C(5))-methyltransferase n=1 Tax=Nippostrongylus brasiliensis TaxID=27835 RepID=A0A0N4XU52_NIPBR|nr:unnamed protein product [Nippostrongylus brasiliensis]